MTTNTLPLTRPMLETLLKYLCDLLSDPASPYHIPALLLVIHGGAAMLLHPSYQTIPTSRQSTLDVDYLAQPLPPAVRSTLTRAIAETARAFPGLGADWMNADADVALPPGVWEGSTHAGNLGRNMIFERGAVRMVSVAPGWAVGLKLMRYEKYDAGDVVVILLNGLRVQGGRGGRWTREIVEAWVRGECATMGYEGWPEWKVAEMRVRIGDAVRLVEEWLGAHPGVVEGEGKGKTITRQTSVMSVQEEAEIREWERKLRRRREGKGAEPKPRGRYLLGQWVEPDDSDSDDSDEDEDSDTESESESDEPPVSGSTTSSYYPPEQHQPSCPFSAPPTLTSPYQPPSMTSPYQPPSQHQSSRPLAQTSSYTPYQPPPQTSSNQRPLLTQTSPYQPPPMTSPYQPLSQHQSARPLAQTNSYTPHQPPPQMSSSQRSHSTLLTQTSPYQPPPLTSPYQPPTLTSPYQPPNQHPYSTPQTQASPYQLPPQMSPYQPPSQHPSSSYGTQLSPYQAPNNSPPAQGYIPPDFSPLLDVPPPSKTPAPHAYPVPPQAQAPPLAFAPNFASPIYASPNPSALLSPLNYNINIPFSTPWMGATNTNMVGARAGWS